MFSQLYCLPSVWVTKTELQTRAEVKLVKFIAVIFFKTRPLWRSTFSYANYLLCCAIHPERKEHSKICRRSWNWD